jgi:hypothetical protein
VKILDNGKLRDMTETELAQLEIDRQNVENEKETLLQIAAIRQSALAKLEALGLTPAEIAALVGA